VRIDWDCQSRWSPPSLGAPSPMTCCGGRRGPSTWPRVIPLKATSSSVLR